MAGDEAARKGKITPWVPPESERERERTVGNFAACISPWRKAFSQASVRVKREGEMTTRSSLSHAIVLLFIEGFLLCGFLATFDYAPEADAGNRQNSYSPHLNGKPSSLPVTYTRKSYDLGLSRWGPTPPFHLHLARLSLLSRVFTPFLRFPFSVVSFSFIFYVV